MSGLQGADVAELRQLASKMRTAGQKLEGQRHSFSACIAGTSWPGPDGDRFRQDWRADHSRTLGAAALFLKQAADELVRHANEQETASAGSGGSLAGGARPGVQASVPGPGDVMGKSAAEVRTWWLGLTASQQRAFVQKYPTVAGNTNGIPFAARIEANRANAQSRIDWLKNHDPEPRFNPLLMDISYPARYAKEHEAWQVRQEKGLEYFQQVVAGEVQLAAYDPAANSIVELIGNFDEETSTVLTYVPGTLTNEASFYSGGGAQDMAKYLVSNTGSTAAFVYKGTEFPDGGPEAFLVEAREEYFVDATAPVLRDFQAAVDVEKPDDAQTVGIGHSWGARNLTGSEAAGAHYDKVLALSGAAIPTGWTPDPHTEYFAYSYPDLLLSAELAGAVGANYPMKEPAFDKYFYAPPGGVEWGDMVSMENHSLITSIGPENEMAMRDIRKEISR
ncbi:hypothetical protein ACFUTU_16555 [Arthrobacter sp. NPDC057388]|uniref:hypothetical protein n=1 Tax=Arthrobacter sp. NPDC057388 TaxID=3346116 RepID=UPI00363A2097